MTQTLNGSGQPRQSWHSSHTLKAGVEASEETHRKVSEVFALDYTLVSEIFLQKKDWLTSLCRSFAWMTYGNIYWLDKMLPGPITVGSASSIQEESTRLNSCLSLLCCRSVRGWCYWSYERLDLRIKTLLARLHMVTVNTIVALHPQLSISEPV